MYESPLLKIVASMSPHSPMVAPAAAPGPSTAFGRSSSSSSPLATDKGGFLAAPDAAPVVDVTVSVVQKGLGTGDTPGAVRHVHVTVPAPLQHHVPRHVYRAEDADPAPPPMSATTVALAALCVSTYEHAAAAAAAAARADDDDDEEEEEDGGPVGTFSGHPQPPSPKPRLRMKSVVFQVSLATPLSGPYLGPYLAPI